MPLRPQGPDPLAIEILERLQRSPEAGEIVLGGYFALREHLDYRATHDLDAWWRTGRSEGAMRAIRGAMEAVARAHGLELRERAWGETVSFELGRDGHGVFSFQIALRTIEIAPSAVSRWPPIRIESLSDNIGSKMNALVNRGAARDFLDIREVVRRGLVGVDEAWKLWLDKNPGGDVLAAQANVLRHLEALERRRPLEAIDDAEARAEASDTRLWIREVLLGRPVRGEGAGT
jgi:hypothetical protein